MKNINYPRANWTSCLLLAMEAWGELAWASIRIRIPFGRQKLMQQAMNAEATKSHPAHEGPTAALLQAVNCGRRFHFTRMDCLEQSLALVRMLRRRGQSATLQIGCRRDGPGLQFHAWVAGADGVALEPGDTENRFAPFVSLRRSGFPA
jgi:hypothetical protein